MVAKIKLVANWYERKLQKELSITVKDEEYEASTLHFKLENLYHFYIDTSDDKQNIVILLYPNEQFTCYWDKDLYKKLEKHFSGL